MFKDTLKQVRIKRKMTQKELANKLHTTDATISRWEKGIFEPDFQTVKKIADIFDVSIDELLGHTSFENPQFINFEKRELLKTMLQSSDTSIMFSSGSSIDELSDEAVDALLKEVSGFIDVKIAMQSKK